MSESRHSGQHKFSRIVLALILSPTALLWPVVTGAATPLPSKAEPIPHDALIPRDGDRVALSNTVGGSPGYYQTSDYLIGHVAVGLILPESDGGQEIQSEDWTADEIAQVEAEVSDALAWWADLEPAAHLTFTVEVHRQVPVGYEPITHRLSEEWMWISATMASLGFENASYFGATRDYVNALRDRTGSDWAFAIFVVDSSADADGRFADNYFAYAYLGGPFLVMTYDNSSYHVQNMDAVAAHEIGHIFRALDQYAAAGVRCDYRAGYLGVKNANSLAGGACESDQPSIMRGGIYPYQTHLIDPYARGQIGWRDQDGDAILDPVDVAPQVIASLEQRGGTNDDRFYFTGRAWQEPAPSPMMADVTISRIVALGARVDGTSWTAATAQDGAFDSVSESFDLQLGPLEPGLHHLEIQARNSEGLVSSAWTTTTFVYDPVDGALNSALIQGPAAASGSDAIRCSGLATAAYGQLGSDAPTVDGVQFSLDGGDWQEAQADDGQFDSAIEGFHVLLNELPDGRHTLTLRALDSEGRIESNVTQHSFEIETTFFLYLPLVRR